jgi:uncharacterized protein involved in exopolysaccharide biosynthesis
LRHLKYNETLFELLSKQYELAKLEEARNAVVIQVIDRAVPPERMARPKRVLIVLLATIIMLFLSVLAVLLLEHPWNKSGKPLVDDSLTTDKRTG